jgi:hypothetical protein
VSTRGDERLSERIDCANWTRCLEFPIVSLCCGNGDFVTKEDKIHDSKEGLEKDHKEYENNEYTKRNHIGCMTTIGSIISKSASTPIESLTISVTRANR